MAQFSPSDAALEGFEVLRRRWRVVAGWAGFQLVAVVALCALMIATLLVTVPFAGDRDQASALGGVIGLVLLGLGGLAVQIVIMGGLFRLLLKTEAPGFLHLRVSADEARIFAGVVICSIALLAVLTAAIAAAARMAPVSPLLGSALGVAIALAGYCGVMRLGLTPVIAFAERRISPAESWRRTRGQTWRLVGMGALVLCLTGLLAIVAWLAVFLLKGALTGFGDLGLSDAETIASHPGRFLFQAAAELLLAPVFLVIGNAPWVAVYQVLSREPQA